ncbi:uncharacterized protein LOC134280728 [Saccostrea cucullata]|uniref:uncharacterized protein LOC134280728 n=1 Tax=Saccostrea cuccullata TaxID=36930 RepID=UPI002ED1A690
MSTDSETMAVNGNDRNAKDLKGDAPETAVESLVATMQKQLLENQKSMLCLTQTVQKMQERMNGEQTNKGEKRKALDNPQSASTSKKQAPDCSKSESEADNTTDEFEELLSEVTDEKESDPDDLLEELAECFGSDDKCSEPIYEKLAKVANEGMRTKLNNDKIKEIGEKYSRPKNVANLITPKVNSEIWAHLNRKVRTQDVRLQKTQALVCKAIVPQLQQLDILLKSKKKGGETAPIGEVTKLAMDSLKLMTFVYCDLSYRRRELIVQPDKNEEFKALCSNDHPVTDNLFGDDLGKVVEDIVKGNKVGSKISGTFPKDRKPYNRKPFGHGYKSNYTQYGGLGKQSHFLGHRSTPHFRKKAPSTQYKQRK